MASEFESRTARVCYSSELVYNFITDIRNFERFIPEGTITEFTTERNSGRFRAGMIGEVNIRISEKIPFSSVAYAGNALGNNDFNILIEINSTGKSSCEVRVRLNSALNPFLRAMAAEPIKKFLETLMNEMESFREWEIVR